MVEALASKQKDPFGDLFVNCGRRGSGNLPVPRGGRIGKTVGFPVPRVVQALAWKARTPFGEFLFSRRNFGILPSMNDELHNDDIDFEPEDEMGETGAAKAKMQKLRAQLKEAQAKRDEYLDGWQRCKADMINARKDAAEAHAKASIRGKEILVEELIPALDGFDMAMQGESWNNVDAAWRAGIESIKSQIESVLRAHGVEIYGKEGESFDPSLHEPIQEMEGGESHKVAKVFRRGYRTGERVLRPAQVAIYA